MKYFSLLIACLSSLSLIPTYNAWSSTQPKPNSSPTIAPTSINTDEQTLAKLQSASFAVPRESLKGVEIADNSQATTYRGMIAQIDEIAKNITVRIDFSKNGNGSGVIVAHQGDTYYVLTAAHVVQNPDQYRVVTPDGESYPVNNATIKIFEGADMAVVQFNSKKAYTVATLGAYNLSLKKINLKQIETDQGWIFVSGFPASTAVNGNPPQRQLTAGRLWSKELADFAVKENYSVDEGRGLVYTAMSSKGMSGGPILDHIGRVIGINTGAEIEEKNELYIGQSLGVPIGRLINRATEANLQPNWLTIQRSKPSDLTSADINNIRTQLFNLKAPSSNSNAYEWLNYCNSLWRSFQFDEAVAACDQAIAKKTDLYQASYLKGLSFFYESNYQQALIAFENTSKINRGFYPAWRWQGLTLYYLKKYPEALSAYEQALSIKQDDLVLYIEKGDVLRELKRSQEAIDIYTQALKIKQHSWTYNNRGNAYEDLGQYKSAIADYTQAISLNPDLASAYNNRGSVYIKLEDYTKAISDLTQAISLNPEFAEPYNQRGVIYGQLDDYQKAIADLTQAISINPEFAEAYNNLGVVYLLLGKPAQAIGEVEKAAQLYRQQENEAAYQKTQELITLIKQEMGR